MGRYTKRKKNFYMSSNKRQKLDTIVGTIGYLATCNTHEDVCVKEGYSILNSYADKIYGPEILGKPYMHFETDHSEILKKMGSA